MIKLVSVEPRSGKRLFLRFSDGSCGEFDFSVFTQIITPMTAPLEEPDFFGRNFIDAGALAWPNGFDLSARSLQERMREMGALRMDGMAA